MLKKLREDLIELPVRAKEIFSTEWVVSKDPVFSQNFYYCVGIVLIDENFQGGFLHSQAKSYLDYRVDDMKKDLGSNLVGVILDGPPNRKGGNEIRRKLRSDPNVFIGESFFQDEAFQKDREGIIRICMAPRDMLIIPQNREVRVYSSDGSVQKYIHE